MHEFRMPSLGADMDKGKLVEWHVKPGDDVRRGQVVADVETEKGVIEVEIWQNGSVQELVVAPGREVPVGTILALVRAEGETVAAASAKAPAAPVGAVTEHATPPVVQPRAAVSAAQPSLAQTSAAPSQAAPNAERLSPTIPPPQAPPREMPTRAGPRVEPLAPPPALAPGRRQRVSPLARKLARSLGVDLTQLTGSGPGGAILRVDVENAKARRPAAGKADAMRHAIATAMARSKREIPHYYLQVEVPMARAMRWLAVENERRPVNERLLPVVLPLKAIARAVAAIPEMNGFYLEDGFHPQAGVDLGMAIALRGGGLVAPAILGAADLTVDELMRRLLDLIRRARAGKLRASEVEAPSLTVTSLGDQGVDTVFGVIYPPQVALVGLGRIRERAWAENGMVGAVPVMTMTLAADHRASDGHRGGLFLNTISTLLQSPEAL
jgi:pyruvate dehydrogenase E2 component (dihydrolipoamide acetyltransferase)